MAAGHRLLRPIGFAIAVDIRLALGGPVTADLHREPVPKRHTDGASDPVLHRAEGLCHPGPRGDVRPDLVGGLVGHDVDDYTASVARAGRPDTALDVDASDALGVDGHRREIRCRTRAGVERSTDRRPVDEDHHLARGQPIDRGARTESGLARDHDAGDVLKGLVEAVRSRALDRFWSDAFELGRRRIASRDRCRDVPRPAHRGPHSHREDGERERHGGAGQSHNAEGSVSTASPWSAGSRTWTNAPGPAK